MGDFNRPAHGRMDEAAKKSLARFIFSVYDSVTVTAFTRVRAVMR